MYRLLTSTFNESETFNNSETNFILQLKLPHSSSTTNKKDQCSYMRQKKHHLGYNMMTM